MNPIISTIILGSPVVGDASGGGSSGPGTGVDNLLLETADNLLLETGDALVLE